jgi:hypothetical protein
MSSHWTHNFSNSTAWRDGPMSTFISLNMNNALPCRVKSYQRCELQTQCLPFLSADSLITPGKLANTANGFNLLFASKLMVEFWVVSVMTWKEGVERSHLWWRAHNLNGCHGSLYRRNRALKCRSNDTYIWAESLAQMGTKDGDIW